MSWLGGDVLLGNAEQALPEADACRRYTGSHFAVDARISSLQRYRH